MFGKSDLVFVLLRPLEMINGGWRNYFSVQERFFGGVLSSFIK